MRNLPGRVSKAALVAMARIVRLLGDEPDVQQGLESQARAVARLAERVPSAVDLVKEAGRAILELPRFRRQFSASNASPLGGRRRGGQFEVYRAHLTERRVPAQRVVEAFDVVKDRQPRGVPAREALALHELGLDDGHEALGGGDAPVAVKQLAGGPLVALEEAASTPRSREQEASSGSG